jgi:response regulator RpfG family c-di-GMP phosphodiesterase
LHFLIKAAGNMIWIQEKSSGPNFLVRGELPFDEVSLARLISRFEDHDWSRPIVKNRVEGTLLGADFPGLRNLVVAPIAEGCNRSGWILSCNLREGREFGTVEASLLNSVATILGTHVRNIELYEQHNELLLSFVRSLVSTLDAKDPYTRGHSERVALIARRLGEEFHLPDEDLHDIYVSGLLHDIGKIGVDDRILQSPGRLSPEEFEKIQRHPMIGYSILQGLRNLYNVLPGVRSHHEMYNGAGYPDGLVGDEIPLMARILAVADSYDAMGSDRPYRKGMPLERIEQVFRNGAGEQWDGKVIDAYFAVRDDIRRICEDYSPANGNLLATVSAEV